MEELNFNGSHLTTTDLEDIRAWLPELAAARGLRLSPVPVALARAADLYFVAEDAGPGAMLDVVATFGGMVFAEYENFDPLEILPSDDDGDAIELDPHPMVDRVLETARQREGEFCRITLRWATDGLLCQWIASAEWAIKMRDQLKAALEGAVATMEEDRDMQLEQENSEAQRLVEQMMETSSFRATPPHKKGAFAKAILSEMEEVEAWTQQRALSSIKGRASDETLRRANDLRSRLDTLAEGLVRSNAWVKARTAALKQQAAVQYLTRIADGWCMPASLATELKAYTEHLVQQEAASQRTGVRNA